MRMKNLKPNFRHAFFRKYQCLNPNPCGIPCVNNNDDHNRQNPCITFLHIVAISTASNSMIHVNLVCNPDGRITGSEWSW